jgi:hypothetical protein
MILLTILSFILIGIVLIALFGAIIQQFNEDNDAV